MRERKQNEENHVMNKLLTASIMIGATIGLIQSIFLLFYTSWENVSILQIVTILATIAIFPFIGAIIGSFVFAISCAIIYIFCDVALRIIAFLEKRK